ncbi:hypothetical protein A6070_01095 [Syntrophotalea acetylenica]|nr:hypothetical protein A6070_01095 [Syntrophotalea acetylenica]
MIKKVRIEEAVGMVLGHEVVRITPGEGGVLPFQRGYVVREEDIPGFSKSARSISMSSKGMSRIFMKMKPPCVSPGPRWARGCGSMAGVAEARG